MLIRFVNLSYEKIAIEKDLKSQIEKIKYEKNEFQVKYNEKELLNQKLLQDYANLEYIIQTKDNNIQELKSQLLGYKKLKDDKIKYDKSISELKGLKKENIKEIEYLISQNKTLNKQLDEKERIINKLENEKIKITQEIKYEKSDRINHKDEKILYYENQLREANQTINKMNEMIKELEKQIEDLQKDIDKHNNKQLNEDYILLKNILQNKDEEIKKLIIENNILNEQKNKLYEDNTKMFNEISILKNEINKITRNQIGKNCLSKEKQNESNNENIFSRLEFNSKNIVMNDLEQNKLKKELKMNSPEIHFKKNYKLNNIFKQNSNEYINTLSIECGMQSSNSFNNI